jgi:hypothetical protein
MSRRKQQFKKIEFLHRYVYVGAARIYEAGESAELIEWLADSLIGRGVAKAAV